MTSSKTTWQIGNFSQVAHEKKNEEGKRKACADKIITLICEILSSLYIVTEWAILGSILPVGCHHGVLRMRRRCDNSWLFCDLQPISSM